MKEITKEYLLLFNTITDAMESLERLRRELEEAQRRAEELYLEREDGKNCCNYTGQAAAAMVS